MQSHGAYNPRVDSDRLGPGDADMFGFFKKNQIDSSKGKPGPGGPIIGALLVAG
jgi:hypothetical protein